MRNDKSSSANALLHAISIYKGSAIILTDPRQSDNPILACNEAFENLTQYRRPEILGRNCRFLQGHGTDMDALSAVRSAIGQKENHTAIITNYRKDGSLFACMFQIMPLLSAKGETLYFFSIQRDVSEVKNDAIGIEDARRALAFECRTVARELKRALYTPFPTNVFSLPQFRVQREQSMVVG